MIRRTKNVTESTYRSRQIGPTHFWQICTKAFNGEGTVFSTISTMGIHTQKKKKKKKPQHIPYALHKNQHKRNYKFICEKLTIKLLVENMGDNPRDLG